MPHSTSTEPPVEQRLYVNDGPLDPSNIARLRPSRPDEPLDELRRRYQEDGYIFLKQLIPRDFVLKTRERYFDFLSPTGILKKGTTPVEGKFDLADDPGKFPGIGAGAVGGNSHPGQHAAQFVDRAIEAHYQDWYAQEFCRSKELYDFIAKFTGWGDTTLGVKRTLLRNNVPNTHAIGVHYDQIFLRYGESSAVTAWVPIGDVAIDGGGLIYLEKGHTLGEEIEQEFTKKAVETGLTEEEARSGFNQNMMSTGMLSQGPADFGRKYNRRWLVSDYEAGDVVLHNAFSIHASTRNRDPNGVIRLATDLRFVDTSRPWDKRWNEWYRLDDGV